MDPASANPFGTRTLAFIIAAGVVLLIGFLLMSGFGNALTPANPIHPSATSRAGVGFAGLRRIVEQVGMAGDDDDATADWDHPGLLILTPRADTTTDQVKTILDYRATDALPTLIVLPKWAVAAAEDNRNWAQELGLLPPTRLSKMVATDATLRVERGAGTGVRIAPFDGAPAFALPTTVQLATGDGLPDPDMVMENGGVLLQPLDEDHVVHLLSEPDLLNNLGMKSSANAQAAIAMLRDLSGDEATDIAFDMTLPRGGAERNLVQLMFTPPFLAVTIAIFAAALLAGFASANRFGPVRREARAVAFGRSALIDNIAALTRAARRVTGGRARHADAVRERMVKRLHAPPDLADDALTAWLDVRAPGYAQIDNRLRHARTESELLEAARDLNDLQREMTR